MWGNKREYWIIKQDKRRAKNNIHGLYNRQDNSKLHRAATKEIRNNKSITIWQDETRLICNRNKWSEW